MSIVRMRKFFQRSIKIRIGRRTFSVGTPVQIVFWGIVIIFVIGAYYSFGPAGRAVRAQQRAMERHVSAVVAKVGKRAIMRKDYERALYEAGIEEMPLAQRRFIKMQILEQMIDDLLQMEAARREGVRVSSAEIRQRRQEMVDTEIRRRFPSKKDLVRYLRRHRMTYDELKRKIEKVFADPDPIRRQLTKEKLRQLVEGRVALSDEELKKSFEEVHARHILVVPQAELARAREKWRKQHGGKEEGMPEFDADELARKRAEELAAKLKKGADFAELAKNSSDDPMTASKGGDLGWIRRGNMPREFDEVAFSLKPGQVSGVVKSPWGYHIIKVEGKRLNLPKDFEKNKERYRQQVLADKKRQAWADYMERLRKETPIEIVDPELRAYKLLEEGKQDEAIAALEEAVKQDPTNVDARYQLALLYKQRGEKEKAVALLREIVESERGASLAEAHLALAELLMEMGKKDEAVESYRAASEWAVRSDFTSLFIHERCKQAFEELGRKDLAKQEEQWIEEYQKRQQETGGLITLPSGGQ